MIVYTQLENECKQVNIYCVYAFEESIRKIEQLLCICIWRINKNKWTYIVCMQLKNGYEQVSVLKYGRTDSNEWISLSSGGREIKVWFWYLSKYFEDEHPGWMLSLWVMEENTDWKLLLYVMEK